MNKHTKVTFSLLLIICMLISGIPIATPAIAIGTNKQASEPLTETLPVEAVETDTAVLRDEAIIIKEDTTLRGEYEKHFLMSDGSYQVALYNEPVHKMTGEEWVEIDNTLTLKTATDGTARYATTDGLVDVSFAQSFDDQLITMQQDDYSVSWGVQAFSSNLSMTKSAELVAPIQAELITSELSTFSAEEQKTLATKSSSTIQYRNALRQSVDLEYVVLPSRVKENIILQTAQDISYYVVTVYTENLSARLLENREIELYNDNGEVIFTMTSPYMYDSVGELSEDITVEMVSKGDGCYFIKMIPNSQWLSDASRVYPVVIDPQVNVDTTRSNIIDNYVLEGAGVQNRNLDRLYIGNRSEGRTRAFIKYDTMPTLPEGAYITSATMTLKFTNGTGTAANASAYQVTGSDWASGTITWANMPSAGTALATNISHNNFTGYSFSCVTAVRYWYSRSGSTTGDYANYGIMLRYYNETVADYNAVYSADYTDASKRPALTIAYTFVGALEGTTYKIVAPGATGTVTWTSSNTSIATVNSSGTVTAIKAGKVTITASVSSTVLKAFTVYIRYPDGVYYIKNLSSGYYLSAENGGISQGTGIVQTPKASSTAAGLRQMWKIEYLSDGRYSIRPLHKLDMGLGHTYKVMLMNIGTTDTYEGVGYSSRWTISYSSNGYAIQKDGATSHTLYAANNTSGATVTTSSTSSALIFRWLFEGVGTINNQVILYDTATETVVNSATRVVQMGETLSLNELGLTAAFVSKYSIDQSIEWSTINPSRALVDKDTGSVTGLVGNTTATIVATHTYSKQDYQSNYSLNITPLPSGTYFIRNVASNKNMDVNNGTLQDSATARQMSFTGRVTQSWELTHLGGSVYSIKSTGSSTAYYLSGSSTPGQLATVSTGSLTEAKRWNVRFTKNGTFVLGSEAGSNNNLALAVPQGSTSDGAVIQQLAYTDDTNFEDEWLLCPEMDYALVYIGERLGDPNMIKIIEKVEPELITEAQMSGYACTEASVTDLLEYMASSKVVSCISHGNRQSILCVDQAGQTALTTTTVSNLNNAALNDLVFIYLGACSTGYGGENYNNLVNALYNKGADNVLGFTEDVLVDETNYWTEQFMIALASGATINEATKAADDALESHDNFKDRDRYSVCLQRRIFKGNANTRPCG